MSLTWLPGPAIFPDVTVWGTPPLPEGGGYIVSHNAGIRDGKPWRASFADPANHDWLGWFESRAAAEAACRRHRRGRIQ